MLVQFPEATTVRACYCSDAYQAAIRHARKAALRDLVIFEGALA